MALTLHNFNDFAKPAFRLITASSTIELIDQKSASVTHRAVKLVCITKFTHSRVDWISPLLVIYYVSFACRCDAFLLLPVYSKHGVAYVCAII